MTRTDPEARDTGLDEYLDAFAGDLRAAVVAPAGVQRQRTGHRRGLTAAVAVLAGVIAAVLVLTGSGPGSERLDVVAEARAALAPRGEIVHMTITVSFYTGASAAPQAATSEQWSATDPLRWRILQVIAPAGSPTSLGTIGDAEGPIHGRVETSYAGGEQRTYVAQRDTLTVNQGYRDDGPAAQDPSPLGRLGGDPAAGLRNALASGTVTDQGEQQVDGRTVRRLVATTGGGDGVRIVYDVDPDTFAPVGGEIRNTAATADGRPRAVFRFRIDSYERLPLDDDTTRLLTIATGANTRVIVNTPEEIRARERLVRKGCVPQPEGNGEKCPLRPAPRP